MYVNGCHCVSTLNPSGFEGFLTTVTKTHNGSIEIPKEDQKTFGPFKGIGNAQRFAMAWSDPEKPPVMPVEVDPSDAVEVKKDEPAFIQTAEQPEAVEESDEVVSEQQ